VSRWREAERPARLIGVAGVKLASVVLSVNASFMFAGFALGAALGSVTIAHGSPAALGWVAAICIDLRALRGFPRAYICARQKKKI
jgi:predicted MFS family arabinose efflux permease